MTRHPPATIKVVDVDTRGHTIDLICYWNEKCDRASSVMLKGYFGYERSCGIDGVITDEGDDLGDHLPDELCRLVLHYCIDFFDADNWLRDYLSDTDRDEGKIFRSRYPIDHDALAKEQRMLNDERDPDAQA
jgi:hypothetical protein